MTIMIPAWVDGTLTPVEKLEAHQRGLRHKAVSVFVLRERDVLLQQRALGKYHTPGLWANTCCTHPGWNETADAGASRRLAEELGITGLALEHRHSLEYRAEVGDGLIEHELVDVFVTRVAGDLNLSPDPLEVMDTRWVSYDALVAEIARHPERFTPWLRIYVADHAGIIFGPELSTVIDD